MSALFKTFRREGSVHSATSETGTTGHHSLFPRQHLHSENRLNKALAVYNKENLDI
jgi:hypothetical protein